MHECAEIEPQRPKSSVFPFDPAVAQKGCRADDAYAFATGTSTGSSSSCDRAANDLNDAAEEQASIRRWRGLDTAGR